MSEKSLPKSSFFFLSLSLNSCYWEVSLSDCRFSLSYFMASTFFFISSAVLLDGLTLSFRRFLSMSSGSFWMRYVKSFIINGLCEHPFILALYFCGSYRSNIFINSSLHWSAFLLLALWISESNLYCSRSSWIICYSIFCFLSVISSGLS